MPRQAVDKGAINGGNGSYLTPKEHKKKQLDEADAPPYSEEHVDDYNKRMEKEQVEKPHRIGGSVR
jgi:hypothetical protein